MKEKTISLIALNIAKNIKDLISENSCKLLDIDIKGGKRPLITIYVYDSDGLLSAGRLAGISGKVSLILEGMPEFKNGFVLELSSPGIYRIFKYREEFNIFSGRKLKIVKIDGIVINGVSKGIKDDTVMLLQDDGEIQLNIDGIKSASLNG